MACGLHGLRQGNRSGGWEQRAESKMVLRSSIFAKGWPTAHMVPLYHSISIANPARITTMVDESCLNASCWFAQPIYKGECLGLQLSCDVWEWKMASAPVRRRPITSGVAIEPRHLSEYNLYDPPPRRRRRVDATRTSRRTGTPSNIRPIHNVRWRQARGLNRVYTRRRIMKRRHTVKAGGSGLSSTSMG